MEAFDTITRAVRELYRKLGAMQFVAWAIGIFLLALIGFRVGIVIIKIALEVIISPIGLFALFIAAAVALDDYFKGWRKLTRAKAALRSFFTQRPSES